MRGGLTAGAWILGAGLLASSVARAEPVTVWLTEDAPDDKAVAKSDLQTGGTLHLWSVDLRYPPTPRTDGDQANLDALRDAIDNGESRWDEFEIELVIAQDLDMVLSDVTLVTGERDVEDLVATLLFEGAAATRAFGTEQFATDDRATPYRWTYEDQAFPKAWIDAYALTGEAADRSDLVDGTAYQDYELVADAIEALPKVTFDAPEGVGEVWLDGAPVEGGATRTVPAGRHYVHLVRGGTVHARAVVDTLPGETFTVPAVVSDDDIAVSVEKVLAGKDRGHPEMVVLAMDALRDFHGGPMFLAATDGRRITIVPFDDTAVLKDTRLVTFTLFGEVGGGVVLTPDFNENEGADPFMLGAAANGALGFELGVSYFQLAGGVDIAFTPGRTMNYAKDDDDNSSSQSFFPQPWIGIGAYFVRPTKPVPVVGLVGTVSWQAPSYIGYGGRLSVGIPIADEATWVRISLGGSYAPNSYWDASAGRGLITGFLRVGFGARL